MPAVCARQRDSFVGGGCCPPLVVCGSRKPSRADMESAPTCEGRCPHRPGRLPHRGEAVAAKRLMRAELAMATRLRLITVTRPLIRPRAGSRPPSPLGEGTLQLVQRFPEELQLRLDGIHQGVELVGGQALGTVALGLGRVIVGLDHQTVGTDGHCRLGQRGHHEGNACRVARVDDNGQMGHLFST